NEVRLWVRPPHLHAWHTQFDSVPYLLHPVYALCILAKVSHPIFPAWPGIPVQFLPRESESCARGWSYCRLLLPPGLPGRQNIICCQRESSAQDQQSHPKACWAYSVHEEEKLQSWRRSFPC